MEDNTNNLCLTLIAVMFLYGTLLTGQNTPHKKMFEYGNISTKNIEYSPSFSNSGDELYFVKSEGEWGKGNLKNSIYYSVKENGKWSTPKIAPFSGVYDDSGPHLSKDGKTLFFISKRPSDSPVVSADIWMVEKAKNGSWKSPVRLDDFINSDRNEYSPRTDKNGNLYFASNRSGGYGQGDLYVAKKIGEKYMSPINLGNSLNTDTGEWNLEINDTGDLILFEASQRKQNLTPYGDLYISFLISNRWTIPQHVKELNTTGSDLYPELINNDEMLYFTSSDSLKSTDTQIYYTAFKSIHKKYKEQAVLPKQYLFVVNRSGHNVTIIDLDNKKLIKKIPVGIGPHEISITKDNRYAFVANYGRFPKPHDKAIPSNELKWMNNPQNTIVKIDLNDFSTKTFSIPKSSSHHGIVTNADGSLVWVTAQNEGLVKELDGNTGEVLHQYKTMPGSHIIKSSSDFSKLFVSNIESNSISIINLNTKEVTHIDTPKGPEGMELSPDGLHLWVLCHSNNKGLIINTKTLKTEKVIDTYGKFPIKLTFINDEVWVANVFSRNITIFNTHTYELITQIELESTPLSIASTENEVYVTLPRKNLIKVFNPTTRKEIGEYNPGIEPDGMAILNDINQQIKS
ncbi:hypothetical protein [Leptobacterium sp. I13]|uniref:YVTN family beta-propeller repeat protein n=1 Tax=Leptobacterium meishanense TaxID=3128904 RepID=UPI0030EE45A5